MKKWNLYKKRYKSDFMIVNFGLKKEKGSVTLNLMSFFKNHNYHIIK